MVAKEWLSRRDVIRIAVLFVLFWAQTVLAESLPIFDVHTHYKWNQEEVTTPEQAIEYLDQSGVSHVVVIGTPADHALKLKALAPERVIALYGPYLLGGEKFKWQIREPLIEEAAKGLASGQYAGIGELHMIGGMTMRWQRSPVLLGLLALGRKYDVPLMVHNEYSKPNPSIWLCRDNPENRFLYAHAGAILDPNEVAEILDACPNVVMDLAARDPWRYVNNPITDASGKLLPEWEALILEYVDRFTIGSDTVWPVDQHSIFDEPDSGWEELPRFIQFHRDWLKYLPRDAQKKLAYENAKALFRLK